MLCRQPLPSRFSGFRRRSRRRGRARARRAGVGAHGHDLDARAEVTPTCSRSPSAIADVYCTVGTHPHQRARGTRSQRRRAGRASRGIRKCVGIGEAGLDYHYDNSPARRRRSASFAPTSPRRARAGCRSSSMRATPTRTSPRSWRRKWGRGAFPAVLHCFTGGAERSPRPGWRSGSIFPSPAS